MEWLVHFRQPGRIWEIYVSGFSLLASLVLATNIEESPIPIEGFVSLGG